LKRFINGYYCHNLDNLDILNSTSNRKVLEFIKQSYPNNLTIQEISKQTKMPENTVYNSVKLLEKNGFIKRQDKHKTPRGKQRMGTYIRKTAWTYLYEDFNFTFNREKGFDFQFAPGSVQYTKEFLDMYHSLVDKKDQDNIFYTLNKFLDRIFRIIEDKQKSNSMAPKIKGSNLICSSCGVNHEVRDFIRALLLHIIDQLEVNDRFIELLRDNECLSPERYQTLLEISEEHENDLVKKYPKAADSKKKNNIRLRLLSVGKWRVLWNLPFIAIDKNNKFINGTIDGTKVNIPSSSSSDVLDGIKIEKWSSSSSDVMIECNEGDIYYHVSSGKTIEDDPYFLKVSDLQTKIKDIKNDESPYFIEANVLQDEPTMELSPYEDLDPNFPRVFVTLIGDDTGKALLMSDDDPQLKLGDTIQVMAPLMMGISENRARLYVRHNHHGSIIKVNS